MYGRIEKGREWKQKADMKGICKQKTQSRLSPKLCVNKEAKSVKSSTVWRLLSEREEQSKGMMQKDKAREKERLAPLFPSLAKGNFRSSRKAASECACTGLQRIQMGNHST